MNTLLPMLIGRSRCERTWSLGETLGHVRTAL